VLTLNTDCASPILISFKINLKYVLKLNTVWYTFLYFVPLVFFVVFVSGLSQYYCTDVWAIVVVTNFIFIFYIRMHLISKRKLKYMEHLHVQRHVVLEKGHDIRNSQMGFVSRMVRQMAKTLNLSLQRHILVTGRIMSCIYSETCLKWTLKNRNPVLT